MKADGPDWGERRTMDVVAGLVDEAWSVIESNLRGLTDEEYFWEPTDDCWGVRRRDAIGSADCWGKGEWVVETSLDGSREPAMATIGWRLMHAFDCTTDFANRAFGIPGIDDWNDIEVAGDAATAVRLMTGAIDNVRKLARSSSDEVLLGHSDADDARPRPVYLEKCLLEMIAHCSEIGVLRQMYKVQHPATT